MESKSEYLRNKNDNIVLVLTYSRADKRKYTVDKFFMNKSCQSPVRSGPYKFQPFQQKWGQARAEQLLVSTFSRANTALIIAPQLRPFSGVKVNLYQVMASARHHKLYTDITQNRTTAFFFFDSVFFFKIFFFQGKIYRVRTFFSVFLFLFFFFSLQHQDSYSITPGSFLQQSHFHCLTGGAGCQVACSRAHRYWLLREECGFKRRPTCLLWTLHRAVIICRQ